MSVDRTELDIRIIEYLYGEHDEPGRDALRAEIDADDLLRHQLNEWLEVDALLVQLPDEDPDPQDARKVMDAARDEEQTPAFKIWAWLQQFSARLRFGHFSPFCWRWSAVRVDGPVRRYGSQCISSRRPFSSGAEIPSTRPTSLPV